MTHLVPRASLVGCALTASLLCLTACTSGSEDDTSAKTSPSSVPSASRTTAGPSEQKLTEQAQAALAAVQDGKMVEAGAERVSDGIHTEPTLSEGRTYRLNLVCFGSGSANLTVTPESEETPVPCDRSVVQQRITVNKPIRIDVNGTKGSSGVIAWQIDAF
ncbi:hypothetical protein ACWD5R_37535 [Streptomyces sp. NPDC002514]|uniref:hypothetical protein n=1 Tax=unclassified Streptomyces TaxID=2593676 RepID=UPI003695F2A7